MQPSWREYADYFAMGLLLELCSVSEVVTWVDRLLEESDRPEEWMIELSTSANRHPLDINGLLGSVPGAENPDTSFRLLIAKLGDVYPTLAPEQERFAQPKHSRLVNRLHHLAREHDNFADDVRHKIFQIYFDLECVEQGYGDWSIIQQDYNELLAAGDSYKQWIADRFFPELGG